MPKAKKVVNKNLDEKEKEETKEILLDDEDKVVDSEIISADLLAEQEDEDDELGLDDEVDPFKDRWEE